ncbi:MAG: asparagine synthase (glutamine-hydrolyzing) [Pseudomonadales bacterium]|nr:asparagine synthase (glutamine-hydrolyzing) [Pseudomonadales bacterium]MDP6826651.1 asparagine synthase (glutamine-hydrolyzing) [Pseudomonadales bacterium]MDP6969988.1 asparagine synthase (glutamine-hydrolyzing) [Pseudomonadales bacterium]
MCGFVGCVDTTGSVDRDLLVRMRDTLIHRGPDDAGLWIDGSVGLAHRRLSIIDLSAAGHQPMVSACGRFALIYNGEIYNFAELREALGEIDWRGASDTEVLLQALALWGVEVTLEKLVGMFAFALYDRDRRTITLVRDRLGIKPLYYGFAQRRLWFASELRALPGRDFTVDADGIALLLRRNHVPAPHTIYREASKLLPGHALTVPIDALPELPAQQPWWRPEEFVGLHANVTEREATEELTSHLREAVRGRLIADVPLGAFLSGGIDSTLVCALMCESSGRDVRTFTIGFSQAGYNEAEHAAAIARHLGTQHQEFYVSEDDVLDTVADLPRLMDEPFADASLLPTYLVSKMARDEVTVALSGDGGDELTLGYGRYGWVQRLARRTLAVPAPLRGVLAAISGSGPVRSTIGRLPTPAFLGRPAPLGAKLSRLSDLLRAESADALFAQTVTHWEHAESAVPGSHRHMTVYDDPAHWSAGLPTPKRWAARDLVAYLPNDCLTKLDRASMGVSLEARVPLLDHRVVQYSLGLSQDVLCAAGESKGILKKILAQYVPRSLTERPKRGFGVPLGAWLSGPLESWVGDLLSTERLERDGYFDAGQISALWSQHRRSQADWSAYLWDVIVFQAWLDER